MEISELKEQQKVWKLRVELLAEIKILRGELDMLPEPCDAAKKNLTPKQIAEMKGRLLGLRSLTFHEKPPITHADYQLIINHKKHKKENIQLTSKIAVVRSALNEFGELPEKAITQAEVSDYRDRLSTKKSLLSQLQQTEEDLSTIKDTRPADEIEKEIAKYQRYKAKHETSLSNSKKASILLERYQKIEELLEVCTGINQRLIEYERFYIMMKEKIVDSITELIVFTNNYLAEVSKILFDSPISIELSTERQLKSGSKRQEINLLIHYKGGQVYNYDTGLSGGEKARINAMLTLAFARYIDSKILIFDEVVSFLDDVKAQQLMDIVHDKELGVPGRIILLASQNCSSGLVRETRSYEKLGSVDLST
jgi:chromosome segregation ATPase